MYKTSNSTVYIFFSNWPPVTAKATMRTEVIYPEQILWSTYTKLWTRGLNYWPELALFWYRAKFYFMWPSKLCGTYSLYIKYEQISTGISWEINATWQLARRVKWHQAQIQLILRSTSSRMDGGDLNDISLKAAFRIHNTPLSVWFMHKRTRAKHSWLLIVVRLWTFIMTSICL